MRAVLVVYVCMCLAHSGGSNPKRDEECVVGLRRQPGSVEGTVWVALVSGWCMTIRWLQAQQVLSDAESRCAKVVDRSTLQA